VKYAFVKEHQAIHSIRRMCTLLSVSSAGYYEWLERKPSARSVADSELLKDIAEIHKASRKRYGSPRVHAALLKKGKRIGRKRVARVMRGSGIHGTMRRAFRRTTDSNHTMPIAKNVLNRQFTVPEMNTHWTGDITYLPTREGWLYLAVVLDLASRAIVGWSMGTALKSNLAIRALDDAIKRRRPPANLLFHSDRGVQYASDDFRELLKNNQIIPSMSRKGNCWDNAVTESFFGTLKAELGDPIWHTREEARAAIFEYIEVWYNRERLHSSIGYYSPEQFEHQLRLAA
jgi:putative transposase